MSAPFPDRSARNQREWFHLAARRPLGELRPGWFYVGRRPDLTEVFVVSATAIECLVHLGYRSAATFDWGRRSEWTGRLELSYALLADLTGRRPPDAVIFSLFHEVIERLPRDGFALSEIDLEMWLALEGRNPLGWASPHRDGG